MSDCNMCGAHNQFHITHFGCVQYWKHRTSEMKLAFKYIKEHTTNEEIIELCEDMYERT